LCNNLFGQVVIPPSRVGSIDSIPGLTNELGKTITNAIPDGFTDNPLGEITKEGRELRIKYPLQEAFANTNGFVSSFVISNSGITTVSFPFNVFRGIPFVQFMYVNIPDDIVLTPIITDLTTNGFTVKFLSTGNLITNEWTIYYLATENLSYGFYGQPPTLIDNLADGANVMTRDGSREMLGKMTAPAIRLVGNGVNCWIAGDTDGNMSWQTRSSANLTDGDTLFKRDGSTPLSANLNGGGYMITNLYTVQFKCVNGTGNEEPPNDYVLTSFTGSGVKGRGTWKEFGANVWSKYPALQTVNIANNTLDNLGLVFLRQPSLVGRWRLNTYRHGVWGDVLDFSYVNSGGSASSKLTLAPDIFIVDTPLYARVLINNMTVKNGIIFEGKLASGAPNNTANRYAMYSAYPVAIRDGLMVGTASVIQNYLPPPNSICAYGGFYGIRNHWIFRDESEMQYSANNPPIWEILKNYYPIIFSAPRAAFYNTTVIIGYTSSKFDIYKNNTGANLLVENDVGVGGDLIVVSNLSVSGSKSFRIVSPVNKDKYLYHSSVEAPKPDLMYRGKVKLENGKATVNIDKYFKMSEGTFVALCKDVDVYVWNNDTWDRVRGKVIDNILTIESENNASEAEVSFCVFGVRKDIEFEIERDN